MSNVKLYKSEVFVSFCHIIALAQYLYAIYYDCTQVTIPDHLANQVPMLQRNFGGRARFLTWWCLVSAM